MALLLGLTLLEAATLAHGAREAWREASIHLRRVRGWLALAPYILGLWWHRQRCPSCGKRLAFLKGGLCDRCAAAALPALRLKAAQLDAEAEGWAMEAAEASRRAYEAERRAAAHDLERDEAASRMEAAEHRARGLAAELEEQAGRVEQLEAALFSQRAVALQWKGLFLRMLALAVRQTLLAARRRDSLNAICARLRWYRTELGREQQARARTAMQQAAGAGAVLDRETAARILRAYGEHAAQGWSRASGEDTTQALSRFNQALASLLSEREGTP
ncbi:MAG: hypothetical protein ACJ8AT_35545 [Hyalangium sp.]|uniref:hypothetical protein n=1 Tax=Hyalangium sp. TaxID=2028555 RepID=UPI00389A980D